MYTLYLTYNIFISGLFIEMHSNESINGMPINQHDIHDMELN